MYYGHQLEKQVKADHITFLGTTIAEIALKRRSSQTINIITETGERTHLVLR